MGKFFDMLTNSMNLNNGSHRAVDRRGVPTSSSRRPERQKATPTNIKNQTALDRAWSISSSIVAVPVDTIQAPGSRDQTEQAVHRLQSAPRAPNPKEARDTKRRKVGEGVQGNITFRKGQTTSSSTKTSSGVGSGALRGASSISSLDSKHKVAPINPLRTGKSGSKDKLDKLGKKEAKDGWKDEKKSDKGLTASNNNRPPIHHSHDQSHPSKHPPPPVPISHPQHPQHLPHPKAQPHFVPSSQAPYSSAGNTAAEEAATGTATAAALLQLESLTRELAEMAREKQALALELQANQGELQVLRSEVARLKMYHEQHSSTLAHLTEENSSLRCRLNQVAHSPLSDTEKQQLLDTHRQHSASAPASIAAVASLAGTPMGPPGKPAESYPPTPSGVASGTLGGSDGMLGYPILGGDGDTTACTTPEWDKHSSSSVSEVACLQDRIMQMQETHYSTNEELQATLQELADLQAQLTDLQNENERLGEEKAVLLESLCRQTERLEDSRTEVDTLKQLLYQDRDQPSESSTEREQKLVELLKNAQEEREVLLLKHDSLSLELQDARGAHGAALGESARLAERARHLESALDAAGAERRELDRELAHTREGNNARTIEISRLNTLLENARAKIDEQEQDRALSDKSELDELLDNARKEKDALESQVASLQEQLSLCQCETARLKEQISILQEECKVTRNNAKCTQSELEYKCDQLRQENTTLSTELQTLQEAYGELQVQAQCHLEDKRQLKALLSETQRHLGDAEGKLAEVEQELESEKKIRQEENAEWEQFQNDLLMTVRVANDFKTEAQQELQNLVLDNKIQKDKVRQLEQQLEKLKAQSAKSPSPTLRQNSVPSETQQSVFTSVQQEMAVRRQKVGLARQDSRLSVKSLIESIENATKQAKAGPGSRSSSTSSLNSIASDCRTINSSSSIIGSSSAIIGGSNVPIGSSGLTPTSPMRSDWSDVIPTNNKCPLREQQTNGNKNSGVSRGNNKNIISDYSKLDVGKTDDSIRESIFQTAKGLDFSRRNSYSDLSERKDPLNALVKNGGSKRNALLKWCQNKTVGYRNIDITNFSSSWNDGLALCALLHTYLPERVPYDSLGPTDKRMNFSLAFAAAESVGIPTTLNINDMVQLERPDWQQVMAYVTAIYKHFET